MHSRFTHSSFRCDLCSRRDEVGSCSLCVVKAVSTVSVAVSATEAVAASASAASYARHIFTCGNWKSTPISPLRDSETPVIIRHVKSTELYSSPADRSCVQRNDVTSNQCTGLAETLQTGLMGSSTISWHVRHTCGRLACSSQETSANTVHNL